MPKKVECATGRVTGSLRHPANNLSARPGARESRNGVAYLKQGAVIPDAYFRLSSLATRAAASRVRKVLGSPSLPRMVFLPFLTVKRTPAGPARHSSVFLREGFFGIVTWLPGSKHGAEMLR